MAPPVRDPSAAAGGIPQPDMTLIRDVALVKNTAVKACEYVCNEAVQIHGGMGYMRETEVENIYRDQRINGIGGGATEIMTELAGKLLGL
jgi:acyl-CoA dehydrogenase